MQIVRISLREIHLPLVEPFRTATGTVTNRRILLLALADRDGAEAWSECVAHESPTYSSETVDTCWPAINDWLAPRVLGQEIATPQSLHDTLVRETPGHRMARAALEMGAWALEAERRGIALARLLVDASEISRERKTEPRTYVETGIALGMEASPEALVERSLEAKAMGYCRIKMKIEPHHDVEYVRAVRDALGPDARLSADANRSYALYQDYLGSMEELDRFGLTMIEQPLGNDDMARHADLQRRIATPICLDESITGVTSAEEMLAQDSGRMVNLKAGRVGGFTESVAIHDTCARAGVPVWCGGMLESGIGRAYNVALASLPNFTEPGDLSPSERYWERDIVSPAWTMDSEGRVHVPLERRGIGVGVDVARIDDLTVREVTLRAG